MTKSQGNLEFYNYFGKFRGLPMEGFFCKNESGGQMKKLPFFVCNNFIVE